MEEKKLTELQKRFVDEYIIDPSNAKAAYMRAGYGATGNGAEVNASRLLQQPHVIEYLQARQMDRLKRVEITQDWVLQRWIAIASADPNELIYHRRVCCRYCFGAGHEYQWVDDREFFQAQSDAVLEDKPKPENLGGYGFNKTIRPHPLCPQCNGEGYGSVKVNDSRDVSDQAKMLFAGVEQTANGIKIKMHSQEKALEMIARHTGMFKDELKITGSLEIPHDLSKLTEEELITLANLVSKAAASGADSTGTS